jgi:hypothetical protein
LFYFFIVIVIMHYGSLVPVFEITFATKLVDQCVNIVQARLNMV